MKCRFVCGGDWLGLQCLFLSGLRSWFMTVMGVVLLVGTMPVYATDDVLSQARSHLDQGEAQQAFTLLVPLQPKLAGEVEFDYLLGIAALESERPDEALFALERVLLLQPGHTRARVAMARAYAKLGEATAAGREFDEAGKTGDLTPEEQEAYQLFLDGVKRGVLGARAKWDGFMEFTFGYDDNVNSVTTSNRIATPAGIVTLDDNRVGDDDEFGSIRGGANVSYPLRRDLSLVGRVKAFHRFNESMDDKDIGAFGGHIGLKLKQGKNTYTGSVQGERFYHDYDHIRDRLGLLLQLQHQLDRSSRLSAFANVNRLDGKTTSDRDGYRYLMGGSYIHAFGGSYSPLGYASLFGGGFNHDDGSVDHLEYETVGIRVGGQLKIMPKVKLYASGAYTYREYDDQHPSFLKKRQDDRYRVRLGARYTPVRHWTVRPEVSYTDNDSNIALNDYDRTMWSISVRRDFK